MSAVVPGTGSLVFHEMWRKLALACDMGEPYDSYSSLGEESGSIMITGVHCIVYSKQAEKLRGFFRDVLSFPFVDAGHDWLIFALPPAELGIHPTREEGSHEMYVMCDDLEATLAELQAKGVEQAEPITEQSWGRLAAIKIPGDDVLRIYEPRHETAIGPAIGKQEAASQGRP